MAHVGSRYTKVSLASTAVMMACLSSLCIDMPVSSLADADKGTFFPPIRQCNGLIIYKVGKVLGHHEWIKPEHACCLADELKSGL